MIKIKKKIKKNKFRLVLKFLLLVILVICSVLGIVTYNWVSQFKSKIGLLQNELKLARNKTSETIIFEEGGRVRLLDLQTIYLLSNLEDHFKDYLQKNKIKKLKNKEYIYFNQTTELKIKNYNSCKDIYCFRYVGSFNQISSNIWKALMGVEDIRFLFHKGVDLRSLARAFFVDLKAMSYKQGGSTLTQQFVKNFFLKSEKSIKRKLKEFVWAMYVESKYTKKEIISFYLNYVYWGSLQGIKLQGVGAASIFYFHKHAKNLSSYEATILISMLKGPYYYHPINRLKRLQKRVDFLFNKLKKERIFTIFEKAWTKKQWSSWRISLIDRNKKNQLRSLISVFRKKRIEDDHFINKSQFDLIDHFVLKRSANFILKNIQKKFKEKIFSYKVFIGSFKSDKKLEMYSRTERNLKKALYEEKHGVGSILKPLIYSILVKSFNVKMNEKIRTQKVTLKLKSGRWSPREAHHNLPSIVSLEYALKHSLNRPVIKLVKRVGFDLFEKELLKYIPELLLPLREYPAQLLGSIELPLSRIFEIYKKLLQECSNNELINNVLNLLTDPTQTTIAKRVGPLLANYHFFGKTGTSNGGMNNWFLFSQGELLGVIWFGREEKGLKKNYPIYGSNTSFLIFKNFILNRGKSISEFECL